jgi:uncharacterized protein YgbK (DUF1537 family)
MDNIIIFSDDLTGANDSGVQFAKQGIPSIVWIDDNQALDPGLAGTASVINVESRSLSPAEAYAKWGQLLQKVDLGKFQVIIKKIDSTLRGNVGKEIQALMDTGYFDVAIVAPAYPQKGRITVGGYQLVHQQLLEDSEISRDPKFPVTDSKIANIIKGQTDLPVGEVSIRSLRNGTYLSQIQDLHRKGTRIIILDSSTEKDLVNIVSEQAGLKILWVGSAGLAEALAHRYTLDTTDEKRQTEQLGGSGNPVLVAAGSVSSVTQKQVETLLKNGFHGIQINPIIFFGQDDPVNGTENVLELGRITAEARQTVASGHDLVLFLDVSDAKKQEISELLRHLALNGRDGGDVIADELGKLAAEVITQEQLSGAVLTGGDIAYRTCKHLGIQSLRIIDEVEEGLPLCRAEGRTGLSLVTKAGAFGNPESMLLAAKAVMGKGTIRERLAQTE